MAEPLSYALPEHLAARRGALRREVGVQIVALSVAVVCLVGAALLVGPINTIRHERQLVIDPAGLGGLPPDIALLCKLGTFRALAIDWAAIRAGRLKEEGKTYEALELHKMVCRLAPRFPSAWLYAAWDMAYNISVLKYSPEERWQWVQNGIRILRDEGIQYNPKAGALYKELGWIYWHKIRDFLDDEHLNYKRALGVQMERVLGAPPPFLTDEEYYDWFRQIVDAPRDLAAFIGSDPEVGALVQRLSTVGLEADELLLDFVARHIRPELRVKDLLKEGSEADALTQRRLELLTDPDASDVRDRLLAAVRSKVLRERYKFDLDWMMNLMADQYGPLDWRNAASHGLYWTSYGEKVTEGQENVPYVEQVHTARLILFSLQSLITNGRVTLWPDFQDPFASYIEMTPDTRYIPYAQKTYLRLGKKLFGDREDFIEGTPGPNFMNGYVTALHTWIELLWLEGGEQNLELAEQYYLWLRENNPHPDGSPQERYQTTLETFVLSEMLAQLSTFRAASGFIRSLIQRAFKHYSLGQNRSGDSAIARAVLCYQFWMEDTGIDINQRRMMQPFPIVFRDELISFLQLPRIEPLYKARLWQEMPLRERQMIYDHLKPYFDRLCDAQQPAWDVNRAFAEPPGMEAFRELDIDYVGERREDLEQGERHKN